MDKKLQKRKQIKKNLMSIQFSKELLGRLRQNAKANERSIAYTVRQAVQQYLAPTGKADAA